MSTGHYFRWAKVGGELVSELLPLNPQGDLVQPSVGRIVHYTSYGTPGGEYTSQCRAAVVTAVHDKDPVPEDGIPYVDLAVLNPTGMFFNQQCRYHDGAAQAGTPDCPDASAHGQPFKYCACGWREAAYAGGTWHWPERV